MIMEREDDRTGVLEKHQIRISMDGRGAWRDNVWVHPSKTYIRNANFEAGAKRFVLLF